MKKAVITKKILVLLAMVLVLGILSGCGADMQGNHSASEPAGQIEQPADELMLTGSEKYVLTLEISQSHFTLDLDELLKDATNKLEIQIPVDKEYYDSVEAGDDIADSFRVGSLIFKGSIGSWKVKVKDKEIMSAGESETTDGIEGSTADDGSGSDKYVITLKVAQSHFTLDLSEHLKDASNDLELQIPVDKDYYDSVEIGDSIADSFRMGSLIFKGSFGKWKVTISDKEVM